MFFAVLQGQGGIEDVLSGCREGVLGQEAATTLGLEVARGWSSGIRHSGRELTAIATGWMEGGAWPG